MPNNLNCFNCKTQIQLPDGPVSRSGTCPQCNADVKVCYNCKHYDPKSYNECHESIAERVLDKDRRNFCDYFSIGSNSFAGKITVKQDVLKKLDNLFKK